MFDFCILKSPHVGAFVFFIFEYDNYPQRLAAVFLVVMIIAKPDIFLFY
jgi:hypothetical protein